ncbi:MAG: hypothetical protein EHM24_23020 [Acidobacteria bacterium]|nr:MAG: hypothetical protein EHM24_23020 [Acidobacteriota bacterium]
MSEAPGPTRLLVRHFYARFLYNDFISPKGEAQATTGMLLGFLAVPGLLAVAGMVFAYSSPFMPPSERLLVSLSHKYQFIAVSMIVTALATTLQWDALALDARDLANLGPLPIGPAALVRAKALALLLFVSMFAVALNLIPSLGFPAVWMSLVPIGLTRALRLSAAHAVVTLGAAAFGFLTVLALRSLVLLIGGPRLFRRLSVILQFLLVLSLLTAFFLVPLGAHGVRRALEGDTLAARLSPPTWFVAAYERLTTQGLLNDPQLLARTKWSFWRGLPSRMQDRLDQRGFESVISRSEARARRQYDALQPAVNRLSALALFALLAVAFAAVFLYGLAHVRHSGRLREALVPITPRAGPLRRLASAAAGALIARHPITRAGFSFTAQTLARSGRHRLYLAGYLAAGLAIAAISVAPSLMRGPGQASPDASILALQGVLAFFLLVGARAVTAVPAELRSNWIFQASWTGNFGRYLAGARRALAFGLALPLLLTLVPLHVAWLGWVPALWHLAVGWLAALVLIELLFLGCRKLPFTCTYVAKGTFKYAWPAYVAAFIIYAYGLARIERIALASPGGPSWLAASLAAVLLALWVSRTIRLRQPPEVVFDEMPEPAALALGL